MDSDTLVIVIALPLVLAVVGVLTVGLILVIRDTVRGRGNFGVNTKPVHCPRCGEPAPAFRKPKNRREMLWGGCTCERCGQEYDKWGQPVEPQTTVTERGR